MGNKERHCQKPGLWHNQTTLSKTLTLLSKNPWDNQFITEVAKGTGLIVEVAQDPIDAAKMILSSSPVATFVALDQDTDYMAFESAVQEAVGLFSDHLNSNSVYFISDRDMGEFPSLASSPIFGNYIQRCQEAPGSAGKYFVQTFRHSLKPRAFGLEGLLGEGTKIQVVKLNSSGLRDEAIQAVADFCKAAKMHKRIASLVSLALDELLMNAIYDAQIDDLGRLVHKKTPRHTVFPLEGPSAVEFHLGYNGQVLGVTVVDNWGSLEKPELLTHLLKSYQGTNYEARASQVSAGLGLGSLCRAGANLYFASESRVRTEVSALFRCSDGYREFRGQTRFVSAQFYF